MPGAGPAWQVAGWDVLILEEWAKAQNEFAVPPAAAAAAACLRPLMPCCTRMIIALLTA